MLRLFFKKLLDRLRNLVTVEGVALTLTAPFNTELALTNIDGPALIDKAGAMVHMSSRHVIGSGYFATLGENTIAGREFTDHDQLNTASSGLAMPVILNQSAARELFGIQNPIGRLVLQESQSYEVVGVVRDLRGPTMTGRAQGVIYVPITMDAITPPQASGLTLMVRSSGGATALEGIRREIALIDPNITIFNIRTLSQSLDDMSALRRYGALLYGSMGLFGLILAQSSDTRLYPEPG
jgi:hypothetical protein